MFGAVVVEDQEGSEGDCDYGLTYGVNDSELRLVVVAHLIALLLIIADSLLSVDFFSLLERF